MTTQCEACLVTRWRIIGRSMLAMGKTVGEVHEYVKQQLKTVHVAYETKIVFRPEAKGREIEELRLRNPNTDMNYVIVYRKADGQPGVIYP